VQTLRSHAISVDVSAFTSYPQNENRRWVENCLIWLTLGMFLAMSIASHGQQSPRANNPEASEATSNHAAAVANYGNLPLNFESNQGQSDPQVKFLSRGNGYSLFLTNRAAVLSLSKPSPGNPALKGDGFSRRAGAQKKSGALAPEGSATKSDTIQMQLANANSDAQVTGADQLPGIANYFLGNDPAKWHTSVPTYAKVQYKNVYDGIDLVYYGNQRQLEYDFIVAPGKSPKQIQLHFAGAQKLVLDLNGDLEVIAANGQIAFHKPKIYQEKDGQRQPIEGSFKLLAENQVAFKIGQYDPSRALTIDPTLAYLTYLGGSSEDSGRAIASDSKGYAYIIGSTDSSDFPVTPGAFDTDSSDADSFVTKLNPTGTGLVYSTYFDAGINAIAIDSAGNAYLTGSGGQIAATPGAFQSANDGTAAFVAKLNATGSALVYLTYLGGAGTAASSIAVDNAGDAYVAGETLSTNFPVTPGAFQTTNNAANGPYVGGASNAFITKLNPTGTSLGYSTYLGGANTGASGIAVDASGNAYVTGATLSVDYPGTPYLAIFPTTSGSFDPGNTPGTTDASGAIINVDSGAFVTKFNPTGTALVYSTLLGDTYEDAKSNVTDATVGGSGNVNAITVDQDGNAYLTGDTEATDFPVTLGAFQPHNNSPESDTHNAFVTKLNASGSALVYSTYLGGSTALNSVQDNGNAIAVDGAGNAFIAGQATSTDFPVTNNAYQKTNYGTGQAFLTELNPSGSSLVYSTYLGGEDGGSVGVNGIAIDGLGGVYLTGSNGSTDLPVTPSAFQTSVSPYNEGSTAFVAKFNIGGSTSPTKIATTTTISSSANPQAAGLNVTFTVTVKPVSGTGVPTGTVSTTVDGEAGPTLTLGSGGSASYTTDALAVGVHTIVVTYSGDANYAASSATLTETITQAATPAATPTFSPVAGSYPTVQFVTIADATPGAIIYFTTNGTTPTPTSTKYSGAITVSATETIEAIAVASGYTNSAVASAKYTIVPSPTSELQFIPIAPCRIADTRNPTGAFGGPELAGGATRTFNVPQSDCGIPSMAAAYSLNVTVVPIISLGYLTIWPAGQAQPTVSTLNSDGRVKANATITPAGTNGGVSVYASDATQFILDIDGYFVPAGTNSSGLEFYPLSPCRVADTRNPTAPLGGPSLASNTARAFPVQSSSCGIRSSAKAYSLNVTAVPHESLGYLSLWPSGEAQPVVSTLNASTGAVTANAAIVPAGTGGDVSILVSDASDVILDVNGYFAPPAAGGLSLYTVTPCRALDTRSTSGAFDGTLTVPIHTSACAPPATAQAYVLNATALPVTSLSYLTLWAAGGAQLDVSTLNASDGAITSNMAIVPTTNGSVDAFSTDSTNLLLDLSSYFAP